MTKAIDIVGGVQVITIQPPKPHTLKYENGVISPIDPSKTAIEVGDTFALEDGIGTVCASESGQWELSLMRWYGPVTINGSER